MLGAVQVDSQGACTLYKIALKGRGPGIPNQSTDTHVRTCTCTCIHWIQIYTHYQ